jgi:hypothetical protein
MTLSDFSRPAPRALAVNAAAFAASATADVLTQLASCAIATDGYRTHDIDAFSVK